MHTPPIARHDNILYNKYIKHQANNKTLDITNRIYIYVYLQTRQRLESIKPPKAKKHSRTHRGYYSFIGIFVRRFSFTFHLINKHMIQTITFSDFIDQFNNHDRKDQFSYNGKKALFDYLESIEEETGDQIELDVIALCCDFTEYQNADDAAKEYFDYEGMTYNEEDGGELKTVDEVMKEALEYLNERTTVIEFDGGIIIQNF